MYEYTSQVCLIKFIIKRVMERGNKSSNHISQILAQDMKESQILNQKFLSLLQEKNQFSATENIEQVVNGDQQQKIRAQFKYISEGKDTMGYLEFRQSLGLLGREDSFISRIFHLIDKGQNGEISIEDYVNYMMVILHGSEIQKEQFGWKIISGGRSQLGLKELSQLFEQISIVWNALTGQIVQPKRRYVEEMFSILDVDQDEAITFQDYRVLYQEQPLLFGWFEYLNNLDINENVIKTEVQKTKSTLHGNVLNHLSTQKNADEVKILMENQEAVIDSKMLQVIKEIRKAAKFGKQKLANPQTFREDSINSAQSISKSHGKSNLSLSTMTHIGKIYEKTSSKLNLKLSAPNLEVDEISRLKKRKQKISIQHTKDTNLDMIRYLQGIMSKCSKAMDACQEYRDLKQIQKHYSPTKLKLKQAKIQAVFKSEQQKKKAKQEKKKKKNVLVYFGHENWNLVLNLMVGLRKSIRSLYELNNFMELKSSHFSQQHKFLLGNKTLKGKNKEVYQFYEIAPVVFEKLRISFGISNLQYQKSVGPESLLNSLLMGNLTALNEKCSTGKSGSFFYLTLDSKIFLKTIPKREFQFFIEIIEKYYWHQKEYNNSLIVRIYGLYKLHIYNNKELKETIYFISMENIFKELVGLPSSFIEIKEVYDLKGSLYGRSGEQGKQLKDNDWINKKKTINLSKEQKQIFKQQIKLDSKFFKTNNVNDYSLMVAICHLDVELWKSEKNVKKDTSKNIFKEYKGGILGVNPGQFYILCIIDILTVFETRKNFEYIFKSTFLSKDVSCIPPTEYCKRFRNFMYKTVDEDPEKFSEQHSQ